MRAEVLEILDIIGLGKTKLRQTKPYLAGSCIDGLVNSANLLELASRLMQGPSTLHSPLTAVKSPGGTEFHFHPDREWRLLNEFPRIDPKPVAEITPDNIA